ncbi:hypothetical protein EVAR_4120_1 [Eumeta japonica]|uniref:Uncharacterized protein n=1 Tax=Eumeta variegata TaxID=151549 RepID=A0A4C1T765_EUMVA|nr:hypothetical protein EVAR_4120_1 [Eumeta japonica]
MVENCQDMDITNSSIAFENLTILKELSNIANNIKYEDFLEIVPKTNSTLKRVKWGPTLNQLKQNIQDEMVQEFSTMWKLENMSQKIEILEKQKEKFTDMGITEPVWRPQLGDVKSQIRAHDVANLQKQKNILEAFAKEYESKVELHKKTLIARRSYLKALQWDILKYQKKNEELILKINEKLENHSDLKKAISPIKLNFDEKNWSQKELDTLE